MTRLPAWASKVPTPTDPLPAEVGAYLDHLRIHANRPETTVKTYRHELAKFVAFRGSLKGRGFFTPIDRASLRRYQADLAAVLPNPRTRARSLVALRSFLRFAADEGLVAADMSRMVTVPRFVAGDPHPIRSDLVPSMLAALPKETLRDSRDRALIHFLISTGCRISEAVSVDRHDLNLDGFRVLGKGSKYRTVYLTAHAWEAVSHYLTLRGEDDSPALFISVSSADRPQGKTLTTNRLRADGARFAVAAIRRRHPEIPGLCDLRSPHSARHTAATLLLEATGDTRLVQEVLGHASLETLRVYTEITDRRKRDVYHALDARMRMPA